MIAYYAVLCDAPPHLMTSQRNAEIPDGSAFPLSLYQIEKFIFYIETFPFPNCDFIFNTNFLFTKLKLYLLHWNFLFTELKIYL